MPLPLYPDNNQKKILHSLSNVKAVVAIAAGKGGVGKSSVTVNLGLALESKGYRVGIMDTDIYGPSIRKMLPEDRLPIQKGSMIQPALCLGLKMISIAYFRKDNEATAVRAPIANGLINHFIKNVEWGELDFLLIDFPPGTGDVQLTLSQQAHLTGAIMVTTPQEVAILDVRKAMALFELVKIPIIGIVENMSFYQETEESPPVYIFGQGGGKRLANEAGVPFLGSVPLDPLLCSCGDKGNSIFELDPESKRPLTRAFRKITEQLLLQLSSFQTDKERGVGSFEIVWKEVEG